MEFKREHQINLLYVLAAMIGVLIIQSLVSQPDHIKTIPYSEFQQLVSQGKVTDLVVGPTQITGAYKGAAKDAPQHFSTLRVDPAFAQSLSTQNVTFSGAPEPGIWPTLLGWIMPTLGFVLVWMFLIRPMAMGQGAEGMMSIGKSKAKVYVEKDIKVTFADVAGVDEAKEELEEVVSFLKDPKSYGRLGARVPKGVLLVGPPGTGKTLLARAVAGEAGVAFFSISGSEFVEMFVGVGAARVRDLFEQARKQAPAIVFIDELDSLGRARGSALPGGGHDEKEQTLNQLLAELDGFDTSIGVVLLAATNRPEILDPALLRAGRFDRQVLVDRPDKKGRVDILGVHLKKIKLSSGVPVGDIAALTPGFSGADLANLVNEAAILATRRRADSVSLDDFTQAIERIVAGLEKRNRLLNPHERDVVAHHEMGHALVAMALPGADPVQKISIIPRGIAALGYTIQRPTEDRFLMDRAELMNRMAVLLGGRAAERLVFDEISTGAADDLAKASEIARSMVVRYGMDPKLGQVAYEPEAISTFGMPSGSDWRPRQYGEQTAAAIDTAIRDLTDVAFECASSILRANRVLLERAARDLLAKETLAGDELAALAKQIVRAKGNDGEGAKAETAAASAGIVADA
ncbi:TPA: ATP-dependent zinc metalloprotease FtsH [Burkholderia contaminans]|uniref:ATP-dependent zinc metalloprotease FtsH n=1 Tax=Burkholderia cepacia complex TaxID=87882 RepID=UPI0007598D42|nr:MULTISPECIES: ATP-dependent zinc metalloprotease FtsH [Burkholderia cepacia complex]KVS22043.1 cell division protein FtsH [Burkholderia vietnamiensis]MBM6430550.1 ATP-dependent zinc metalloprotease FtsH [Burkholderia contaminans]MCA7880867.1 ATP-dependent zinc metalloprotease FtsH [Burkholderia contaminans]MDN8025809.1 ATP-dependent zinc metalloprotease FtsH [Burkholderia contaminans]PRG04157.1 ATP-dependent metallopeptidase FtsH/Yme1/Tma family protein [Burkholderia contaminans]